MTEQTKADAEALTELLQSRGWALFVGYSNRTWNDEFHRRVLEAVGMKLGATMEQMQLAQGRLQQAAAIKAELENLFRWPQERVNTLRNEVERESMALSPAGRRGSL